MNSSGSLIADPAPKSMMFPTTAATIAVLRGSSDSITARSSIPTYGSAT